jgi:HSP20 family protein
VIYTITLEFSAAKVGGHDWDISEKSTRKEDLTMLMRTDPFRELDRFTQQVFGAVSRPGAMPMDAYRKGDEFLVHFDLPGIDPDSIDLTVEQNVLTVRAERSALAQEGAEMLVTERPSGTFTRQLFLGETLDTEHIEANYDAGVLTLTIPVHQAAKPRKVAVTSGDKAKQLAAAS